MRYQVTTLSADESASFTITAETTEVLGAGEEARLMHHLDAVAKSIARRYVRHVATWGAQQVALHKLTAEDAEVLGLLKDWRAAQHPHAWGNGLRGVREARKAG